MNHLREGLKDGLNEMMYQVALEVGTHYGAAGAGWFGARILGWAAKKFSSMWSAWRGSRVVTRALAEGVEASAEQSARGLKGTPGPTPKLVAPNRPVGYTRMQDYIPSLGKPSLPATTPLTPQQVFALQENLQAVMTESMAGYRQLIASGRPRAAVLKGLQNQMFLLRWRFIDQIPGGREAIQSILREFPEITFPY
jgi:hypothetical protein